MSFPHINTKTKNYTLSEEIGAILEKRLATLSRVLPKGDVVCDVELEKKRGQRSGDLYRTEINIAYGKVVLRAEAAGETMEAAIDEAKDEMKRELAQARTKTESQKLKGARKAKAALRG